MLRLFKGTKPGTIALLILTGAALWITSFRNPPPSFYLYGDQHMPLYRLLTSQIDPSSHVGIAVAFLLVMLIAILLVAFNTGLFFINRRTFLPAVVYIIMVSIFTTLRNLNPALISSLFLIVSLRRIVSAYRREGTAYCFYDATLIIGLGSMFYFNLIWFGFLAFVGVALFRSVNIRELIYSLAGLITPYILLAGIYYVTGHDMGEVVVQFRAMITTETWSYEWSRLLVITGLLVLVSLLISLFHLISVFNSKKIRSRKVFSLIIWLVLITIPVYFLVPSASEELIFIFAAGATYILSHFYVFSRGKVMPEVMFTGTLLLVLLLQFLN